VTKIDDRIKRFRLRQELENWQRLANRILPLHAFYGRKDEQEAERNLFYDRCAKVFGWKGWEDMTTDTDFDTIVVARSARIDKSPEGIGHGGRGREVAAIQRDRAIAINLKSAPFEWLSSKGYLESRDDKAGIGNIRFSAGMKFRDLLIGAEPMALKSANLEGGSGGGGVPIVINDFKMDCITALNRLKADLIRSQPKRWGRLKVKTGVTKDGKTRKAWIAEVYADERPVLFLLLEKLIYRDIWIFDSMPSAKRKAAMDQLHYGLDQVAVFFGMITPREFDARWQSSLGGKARARRSPHAPA
jgi:hypothetical protein